MSNEHYIFSFFIIYSIIIMVIILKKKKKFNIKLCLLTVISIIFLTTIMISSINILFWVDDNSKTEKKIKEIENISKIEEKNDNENTELVNKPLDVNDDYWYYTTFPLINVDLEELKKKNNDTVGWINVNNTNINYPYVQYSNNDYYLHHSFDKSSNEAGWVFLDYRNNEELTDKNNIIYGHHRVNNTMFTSLLNALDYNWYTNKDNHIIRISTKSQNSSWQIISVYKIPIESYYITVDFNTDEDFSKFLNTIIKRSIYDFKTEVTIEDKILTLSTCYNDDIRMVVHAKLIKKEEKN